MSFSRSASLDVFVDLLSVPSIKTFLNEVCGGETSVTFKKQIKVPSKKYDRYTFYFKGEKADVIQAVNLLTYVQFSMNSPSFCQWADACIVQYYENIEVSYATVPYRRVGSFIGAGGSLIRNLMNKTSCNILVSTFHERDTEKEVQDHNAVEQIILLIFGTSRNIAYCQNLIFRWNENKNKV